MLVLQLVSTSSAAADPPIMLCLYVSMPPFMCTCIYVLRFKLDTHLNDSPLPAARFNDVLNYFLKLYVK